MNQPPIYLDHNASTPVLPDVVESMLPYLQQHFGNPSSTHYYGRVLHDAVERAREQVAHLIECRPEELFFTSGGTEANNLAIRGVTAACPKRKQIITSVIEHPATVGPCALLEREGYTVNRVDVDQLGRVILEQLANQLSDQTALVSIMHANSETGTLQPIRKIANAAHTVGALMHTDAAQSCGKVKVSAADEGVDLLSIAGHKLYAPQGIGALFVRSGTSIEPLVLGANHERGLRPGTENVASIVGFGTACDVARQTLSAEATRLESLRDQLWQDLKGTIPGLALNGCPAHRLPNTLNVRFPGVSGNALLASCPEIAASTGSACHEGGDSPSEVILAMGVPAKEALGSVRLTLGRHNNNEQIGTAAKALIQAWQKLT